VNEVKYQTNRIDRMYQAMKLDVRRHETLSYELACKFEEQHKVLISYAEHIESLKTYTLTNDLHMEAYLPLQIASISFECGKGIVQKNRAKKYEEHFGKNLVKILEKNCLNVCDPENDLFVSKFKKMNY